MDESLAIAGVSNNVIKDSCFLIWETLLPTCKRSTGYIIWFKHYCKGVKNRKIVINHVNEVANIQPSEQHLFSQNDLSEINIPKFKGIREFAIKEWKDMNLEKKEAWKHRSSRINNRMSVGEFEGFSHVSSSLLHEEYKSEWSRLKDFIRNMMLSIKERKDMQRFVRIGGEKLKVCTQIYRKTIVTPLIRNLIFGNQFENLVPSELVYQTPNVKCIHLCSADRISRLFTLSNSDISRYNKNFPFVYVGVSKV